MPAFSIQQRVWFACTLLFLSTLSGCGFHLRGQVKLDRFFESMYISGRDVAQDPLKRQVVELLRANSIEVLETAENAPFRLDINQQQFKRRLLSIDQNADENEFEVELTVIFTLRDQQGVYLVNQVPIKTQRIFQFDQNNVISKSDEEDVLREEMIIDTAGQLLRRLETLIKNHQNA